MSLKLLTLLALSLSIPDSLIAQDSVGENGSRMSEAKKDATDLYKKDERAYKTQEGQEYKYNTFTSGSSDAHKFNNKARAFRDWAISIGGGTSFIQRGDLTSFYGSKVKPGYNFYVSLDKQLSHTFGISLQYQFGRTKQRGMLLGYDVFYPNNPNSPVYKKGYANLRGVANAETKYRQISILGDLNLSNLFRRVDNRSPYRWALHAYAGLGVQGFDTYRKDEHPRPKYSVFEFEQAQNIASFFYQGGIGLKYNLSKLVDIEARVMYIITGDDEFDGGGDTPIEWPGYNLIKKNDSDNMLTANLGLSFKLGKKGATHLAWYDPLQEIYYRTESIKKPRTTVCEKGDMDNDGVCDDWDRQLDTPIGARVDGAGVALDLDLDGVIDLYDKCVTEPGSIANDGCPEKNNLTQETESNIVVNTVNRTFEGVEFELNKYKINNTVSVNKLNEAAKVINSLDPMPSFLVIGATDTRGTEQYNEMLSQKRANSVVNYLVTKGGVPRKNLIAVGRGEKDLKYPECDPASKCPEWKNKANRRVYIETKK